MIPRREGGGETEIVQTGIGPSLIKRVSRSTWLALIDSAKILTITTGALFVAFTH